MMHIDVVSDFVCPWCFIGLRRLEAALAQACAQGVVPRVSWHPYFLNPHTPPAGEPYRAFMERKFGSAAAVEALHARVAAAASGDGIGFRFGEMPVRPSTRLAHGVVAALQAAGQDVGGLVPAVFSAHFLELRNIGDPDVLASLVEAAGLPTDVVAELARAPADITALTHFADALRLDGVPAFVFDRRQAVLGAQPAGVLLACMTDPPA
ncbi:MAG: DsbA family oxidoreductase [Rhodocyclaceae bacterium]|nr:DsbA family oxidoreductase [Rhodocyclaceae bacterium]